MLQRKPVVYSLELCLVAYAGLLASLIWLVPFWLDEVLQLLGTHNHTFSEALQWAARNPGGAPLPYLAQWASLQLLGYSPAAARLPAAISSILAALAFAALLRQLKVRNALLAFALFLLLPLHLRYGFEARPYSQGLFFSILATSLALRLAHSPKLLLWFAYTLTLAAAVYSQPYASFVAAGHLLWIAHSRRQRLLPFLLATAAAALSFLPWMLKHPPQTNYDTYLTPHMLLLLLREFSGGGYFLSILLIALIAYGAWRGSLSLSSKRLLAATALLTVACALTADVAFGYFVAIRQMIFALPALCILAAEGLSLLPLAPRAALLAVLLFCDVRLITRPHEDWAAAAHSARTLLAVADCAVVAPANLAELYEFFEPSLKHRRCRDYPRDVDTALAITSPYTSAPERAAVLRGFVTTRVLESGGSSIHILRRRPRSATTVILR
jgi:4-amino-4-deoxy-L-arabinose transferase-like glycosyltransferase